MPGPELRCIPCETRIALADGAADLTSLYRFFDAEGQLLYVGITARNVDRMHNHARHKPWWHHVATATFQHFPNRALALLAEAVAIRIEHPVHNVAGAVRVAVEENDGAELPAWAKPVVARLRGTPLLRRP